MAAGAAACPGKSFVGKTAAKEQRYEPENAWKRAERQRINAHLMQIGREDSLDERSMSEMDREEPLEVQMLNRLNELWEGK